MLPIFFSGFGKRRQKIFHQHFFGYIESGIEEVEVYNDCKKVITSSFVHFQDFAIIFKTTVIKIRQRTHVSKSLCVDIYRLYRRI